MFPEDRPEGLRAAQEAKLELVRNKLMLDLSHVIRREAPETDTSNRIRFQWDWSF